MPTSSPLTPHSKVPQQAPTCLLPRSHQLCKSFTLLELIVVIVVLAVLAALAVPTFQAAIERAENENAATTLASLIREASALAAFRGETTFTPTDFSDALADMPAYTEGGIRPGCVDVENWSYRIL